MSFLNSPFMRLPSELHLQIASYLPFSTITNLIRCNRHIHSLLSHLLVRRAAWQTFNPGAPESRDRTPLHYAAATHNIPLLTSIITSWTQQTGSPTHKLTALNHPDHHGLTPLLSAIIAPYNTPTNRVQTVAFLLRHAATPEYRTICDSLHACGNSRKECSHCCQFPPPLWYAVVLQEYEIISLLLAAGADAGTPLRKHQTRNVLWKWAPLYTALLRRDVRAVKILLYEGKMEEKAWLKPMHWAFDRWREGWEDMKPVFREWMGEERWGREFPPPRPGDGVRLSKSRMPVWDDRILKEALASEWKWWGCSYMFIRQLQLEGGTVAAEQEWPGEGCKCGCGAPKPHRYLVRGHRGWWTWRPEFR